MYEGQHNPSHDAMALTVVAGKLVSREITMGEYNQLNGSYLDDFTDDDVEETMSCLAMKSIQFLQELASLKGNTLQVELQEQCVKNAKREVRERTQ